MIYRRYNAVVARTNDPLRMGRIRVFCAELLPQDVELPAWVEPSHFLLSKGRDDATGTGFFWVPEIGSKVLLEVTWTDPLSDARPGETFISAANPRYFPSTHSNAALPGADFGNADKYPCIRGFRDPAGHVLIFDSSRGDETITIRHSSGASYVTIAADGTMTLHAPVVQIDKDADTHLVRGEDLKSWIDNFINNRFNTHIHPTGVGPSDVPTVPATTLPSSALSSNHKVK